MITALLAMVASLLLGVVLLVRGSSGVNEPLRSPDNPFDVGKSGGIEVDSGGAVLVDFYYDYMCNECADWDDELVEPLRRSSAFDDVTIAYHPLTMYDAASAGSDYSTRAAGAAFCAANGEQTSFTSVHRQLFASRPQWGKPGPRNDTLIAALVTAGGSASMGPCIIDDAFEAYAQEMTRKVGPPQRLRVPRLLVNGEELTGVELTAIGVQGAVLEALRAAVTPTDSSSGKSARPGDDEVREFPADNTAWRRIPE